MIQDVALQDVELQNIALQENLKDWRSMLKKYQQPDTSKAVIQILNSFLPYIGLWILMYFSLNWSYLITVGLSIPAAFFLIRIFVIQHDCGHQSFLKSRKVNNFLGFTSSAFSTIPYKFWSQTHNLHHAHNGQMEYRGIGDITFLSTEEFQALPTWRRNLYRLFRSPAVTFFFAPIIYLIFSIRYPLVQIKAWKKVRRSHLLNNFALVIGYTTLAIFVGWKEFLLILVPTLFFFGMIAYWLFYIQHQHEENYKAEKGQWDHLLASMRGSTYYKLPKLFQWLSGNIGFHHIHHLNSQIPNYHLERCVAENPIFNEYVTTLNFRQSLKCINLALWYEQERRMISFREYHRMQR